MYMYICTCTHLGCKVVNSGRKQFKIYGPAHFAATWRKYLEICERDGTNASREIRKYVAGQVARRAPGNPQPPLTAFIEGHEDADTRAWSTMLKELLARAEHLSGELSFREILLVFKDKGVKGPRLPSRAQSMARALEKLGVKIWY